MIARGFACLALLAAGAGACGGATDDGSTFIALQRDFAGFTSWQRYDLGQHVGDAVHAEGNRLVYLNKVPPAGSTVFPDGTVLVKTIGQWGNPNGGKTFAMAKRGGTYNAKGASGWEWFELKPAQDGSTPVIVWRGITPPRGEQYSGVSGGACNACHAAASDNDFVPSEALRLSGF